MKSSFFLAALVSAAFAMSACSETPSSSNEKPAAETPATVPTPAAPETPDPRLASLPAPYNEADLKQGRRQFAKCRSCHLIEEGAPHRIGPNLHGMFTRKIGALEDFNYSDAVLAADFDWTPAQLDAWLANPKEFLPGNRMSFAGIAKEEQRRNLIAYLLIETAPESAE